MPIYEYKAVNKNKACDYCRKGFEELQKINDKPILKCPRCGIPVKRVFTTFSQGYSKSNFDRRAQEKGFHKLKRVDKGTYEKLY